MRFFSIILFSILGLWISNCTGTQKKSLPAPADSTALEALTEEHLADTSPPKTVAPSPGTVKLEGKCIDAEETADGWLCNIQIASVHAYGSSTPPVPEGSIIRASISHQILQTQASESQNELAHVLSAGRSANFTLKYRKAPDLPGLKPITWQVLSIK